MSIPPLAKDDGGSKNHSANLFREFRQAPALNKPVRPRLSQASETLADGCPQSNEPSDSTAGALQPQLTLDIFKHLLRWSVLGYIRPKLKATLQSMVLSRGACKYSVRLSTVGQRHCRKIALAIIYLLRHVSVRPCMLPEGTRTWRDTTVWSTSASRNRLGRRPL